MLWSYCYFCGSPQARLLLGYVTPPTCGRHGLWPLVNFLRGHSKIFPDFSKSVTVHWHYLCYTYSNMFSARNDAPITCVAGLRTLTSDSSNAAVIVIKRTDGPDFPLGSVSFCLEAATGLPPFVTPMSVWFVQKFRWPSRPKISVILLKVI